MTRFIPLLIVLLTSLSAAVASAQDDDVVTLWAEIEDLGGEQLDADNESDGMALGVLEPLIETFVRRHSSTTSLEGLEEDALSLDDCWCPTFYEDRGPKRETGLRLVAKYTFEF